MGSPAIARKTFNGSDTGTQISTKTRTIHGGRGGCVDLWPNRTHLDNTLQTPIQRVDLHEDLFQRLLESSTLSIRTCLSHETEKEGKELEGLEDWTGVKQAEDIRCIALHCIGALVL